MSPAGLQLQKPMIFIQKHSVTDSLFIHIKPGLEKTDMVYAFEILCLDFWIELIVSVDELETWEILGNSFVGPFG